MESTLPMSTVQCLKHSLAHLLPYRLLFMSALQHPGALSRNAATVINFPNTCHADFMSSFHTLVRYTEITFNHDFVWSI